MRFIILICFFALANAVSCAHGDAEKADQLEKEAAAARRSSAFTGTYLQIPANTILINLDSLEFTGVSPLNLRTNNNKLVYCQLFRKAVNVGTKRLYKLTEGTKFTVIGTEDNMPLDQGDVHSKTTFNKSGRLLLLEVDDKSRQKQYFGLGCARTGKPIPEANIMAEALRASFDSLIFKDVEIVP